MAEEEQSTKNLSRRQFLKAAVVAAAAALTVSKLTGNNSDKDQQLPTLPPPKRLPDSPPSQQSLQETRVVLEKTGKTSSFEPEGKFTQELFDRVQASTFLLSDAVEGGVLGTCWCAGKEERSLRLVTNRHVVLKNDGSLVDNLRIHNPITEADIDLSNRNIKYAPEVDIAVIEGDVHFASISRKKWFGAAPLQNPTTILTLT